MTILTLAPRASVLSPTKHDAPCCAAQADKHGRLPIGYCGPLCQRRDWDRPAVMDSVLVVQGNAVA